jgi:hypothetical protein
MAHIFQRSVALPLQPFPCLEDEAAGAVFAELLYFLFFEDAEGFAGE